MYHVLQLTYTQPLDVVDAVRPAHLEWLDGEIAAGNLLISGRNEAGTGGVLVTGDISAQDAEALIAADPYTTSGVAEYTRIGFNAGRKAEIIP
ncbi:YciI family protein [Mycobacteroides chelonae]|uniref:YciI family protein n=1 Tax=Mycobacteroides chelonae TaxID=1774 RepID=UPI001C2C6B72|nr:YciI family protein [Mycobacteroides chelonae]MBV0916511.1 GTP cyclohydrolase [Mycobacteroides chelonae]